MAKDVDKESQKNAANADHGLPVPIDELGLSGLSSLLAFPPAMPFRKAGERRSGQDRRKGERRGAVREFKDTD